MIARSKGSSPSRLSALARPSSTVSYPSWLPLVLPLLGLVLCSGLASAFESGVPSLHGMEWDVERFLAAGTSPAAMHEAR